MMADLKAMHKDIDKARALREKDKTLDKQERVAEKKAKDKTAMATMTIFPFPPFPPPHFTAYRVSKNVTLWLILPPAPPFRKFYIFVLLLLNPSIMSFQRGSYFLKNLG